MIRRVIGIWCLCFIFVSAVHHRVKHKKKERLSNNAQEQILPLSKFTEDDLLDMLGPETKIQESLPQPIDELDLTVHISTTKGYNHTGVNVTTATTINSQKNLSNQEHSNGKTSMPESTITTARSTTSAKPTTKSTATTTPRPPRQYITRRWFDVDGVPRYKKFDREELTANDVTRFHKIYRRQMSAFYISAERYKFMTDLLQAYVEDTDNPQVAGEGEKKINVSANNDSPGDTGDVNTVCLIWREFAARVEYAGKLYTRIQEKEKLAYTRASHWYQLKVYAGILGIKSELLQVVNSMGWKYNNVQRLDHLRTIMFPIHLRQLHEFTQKQQNSPSSHILTDVVNVTLRYTTNARYVMTFRKHLNQILSVTYPPSHYSDLVKMKSCVTREELLTTPISYDALYVWISFYRRTALSFEPRFDSVAFQKHVQQLIDRKTAARNMRRVFGKHTMKKDRHNIEARFHSIVGSKANELLQPRY